MSSSNERKLLPTNLLLPNKIKSQSVYIPIASGETEGNNVTIAYAHTPLSWVWYLVLFLIGLTVLGLLGYIVYYITTPVATVATVGAHNYPSRILPVRKPTRAPFITLSTPKLQWELQSELHTESIFQWSIANWNGSGTDVNSLQPKLKTDPAINRTYYTTIQLVGTLSKPLNVALHLLLFAETTTYQVIAQSGVVPYTNRSQPFQLVQLNSWTDRQIVDTCDRMAPLFHPVLRLVLVASDNSTKLAEWSIQNTSILVEMLRPPPFPSDSLQVNIRQWINPDNACISLSGECVRTVDCERVATLYTERTLTTNSTSTLLNISQMVPSVTGQVITCPSSLPSVVVLGSSATSTADRNGLSIIMSPELYRYFAYNLSVSDRAGSLIQRSNATAHMLTVATISEAQAAFEQTFVYNALVKAVFMAQLQHQQTNSIYLQLAQCVLSSKLGLPAATSLPLDVLQADICSNADCYDIVETCETWLATVGYNYTTLANTLLL